MLHRSKEAGWTQQGGRQRGGAAREAGREGIRMSGSTRLRREAETMGLRFWGRSRRGASEGVRVDERAKKAKGKDGKDEEGRNWSERELVIGKERKDQTNERGRGNDFIKARVLVTPCL
ncbi:hypothetical protein Syun_012825 [Stephania yunnanensis]|uniref:Uncharacterized protein n=1 Tax=Stephania yunnanensis TaxID=152371 RepID=A0AAP0PJA5_9MAGN